MAINNALMQWLGKEAASKTFRTSPPTPSKPSGGMSASHGPKPSNTQSPHRLGRKFR
jgi:hypothetical protein